ncbi:MAG: DoxX family protein [Actinobacteria bacterium]|nr:DoxX family protein [Actinomycetota bacterium]
MHDVSFGDRFDVGVLVLRVIFGLFLAYHGLNKVKSGIAGTTGWFRSIGFKWPGVQARLAAATEMGAGVLLAVGLLTPLAASGMIAVMIVAIVVAHWKVGFFIFKPNQGWEYCASIAITAWVIATVGPGRFSLDHAFDIEWSGWWGSAVAAAIGIGGAVAQLLVCYRPAPTETT